MLIECSFVREIHTRSSINCRIRGHSFITYAPKGVGGQVPYAMYFCHSDVIICAYRVGDCVRNSGFCAYVINESSIAVLNK